MGAQARVHSGSFVVSYAPMVTGETRADFEAYMAQDEVVRIRMEDYELSSELKRAQDEQYGYETGNKTVYGPPELLDSFVGTPPGPIFGVDGPHEPYKIGDAGPFFPEVQVRSPGMIPRSVHS